MIYVDTKEQKMKKCSLCGKTFVGAGYNPEPLEKKENECCRKCSITKVLPLKIELSKE